MTGGISWTRGQTPDGVAIAAPEQPKLDYVWYPSHWFIDGLCTRCGSLASEVPSLLEPCRAQVATEPPPKAVDPTKPVNPKDGIGSTKLPLHLWPASATAHGCLALLNGALKYGRLNWRGTEVRASVYVAAAKRHLEEWQEGVNADFESGLHPLAHLLACVAIILDAEAAATLIDDRNYPGGYNSLAMELTPHVARLQALYAGREPPHHWTILDTIVSGAGDG